MTCLICGEAHTSCKGTVGEPKNVVTIIHPETPGKGVWTSDRRLYLDKDGNVVEGKGPNRVSLLVAAGGSLPMETARKYGLVKDAEPEPAPVPKIEELPEVKAEPMVEAPQAVTPVAEPEPEVIAAPEPKPAPVPEKTKAAKKAAKPAKK